MFVASYIKLELQLSTAKFTYDKIVHLYSKLMDLEVVNKKITN